jgi:hypothetical protein
MTDRPTLDRQEIITPEMIEAGKEVFFRMMIDGDYLASVPSDKEIVSILASVFASMSDKRP